ncbi:hypothetical protein BGZ70_001168 [Mortierella alpina]|uniref:Uncharacterized protein n=1 Tax=Mortierella alpina TaxID=64518 RepID=A0A9P6JE70_MORAP|nr:hypothetical protein BGZ70_001168 [Mortierella alpina]
MCIFSLCYLGRIKRTMARDLEFRITNLVVSKYGGADTNGSDSGARPSAESHKPHMELRLDHTAQETMLVLNALDQDSPGNEITEKDHFNDTQNSALYRSESKRVKTHPLDPGQGVNANEESSGKGLYAVSLAAPLACVSHTDEDVALIRQHQQNASLCGEERGTGGSAPSVGIHVAQFPPSTTVPIQRTAAINGGAGAPDIATRLPYGDRMATLSFYDDLLATISSERMIYTTSLSNGSKSALLQPCHSTVQGVKMDCNSCSSMQLTYGSNTENDERSILSRPVHPFDIDNPSPTSGRILSLSPAQPKENLGTGYDNTSIQQSGIINISNGFRGDFSSQVRQEGAQKPNPYTTAQKRSSRRDSSHSQDIIENWRIHVAPSSPTIPELYDNAHDTLADRANTPTVIQNGYIYRDSGEDTSHHSHTGCTDRRGTIPIILSSHLQDARATNCVEEHYFFSAEDLEAPRPPYAYGQTRTQRQGSVNSSIGGYNYSTAASSPSLADSLSNPMYQQQSFGIMNNSTMLQPRPLAPRKGSLPTSLYNRPLVDEFCLTSVDAQPQSRQQPFISLPQATPSRIRSNMPSQLSNMVAHSGNTAEYGMNVDNIHTPAAGEQAHVSSQYQRGHGRSQSQGACSSVASWDQGGIEDAKAGYTTLMDIPAITPSHMGYYNVQDDAIASLPALRSNGIMGLREDITSNDGSADYGREAFGQWPSRGDGQQYSPSKFYRNDISDAMVHPLDLSPLVLQTHAGNQHEFNRSDAIASSGAAPRQDRAWDETCVGLGLTFDLDHSSVPDSSDNEGSIFIHYPHERPTMVSSMGPTFLTHTAHSHQPTYSQSYTSTDMTTATTNNIFDEAFMNSSRSPTLLDSEAVVSCTMPYHDDDPVPTLTRTLHASPATESNRGRPPQVRRQSSQRNKKNLIVNIVPL